MNSCLVGKNKILKRFYVDFVFLNKNCIAKKKFKEKFFIFEVKKSYFILVVW